MPCYDPSKLGDKTRSLPKGQIKMDDELKDQVVDYFAEGLEPLVDKLINDDLLKDLPILGTVVRLARISRTVTDRIYLSKMSRFLFAPTTIKDEDRQKFRERLQADEKLRKKTGEVVILLLDRFDDLEKPEMLAKILAAFIKGEIDFDQFRRFASVIDLAYLEDLKELIARRAKASSEAKNGLLRTGLTEISRMEVPRRTNLGEKQIVMRGINITNMGALFIEIMNGEFAEQDGD